MEKPTFGALLNNAFRRCVERQLSRLLAINVLFSSLALLPLIVGMTVLVMMVSLKQYVFYGVSIITVLAAMVLYYLPCIYFICLVNYGLVREILYPEARIGRGLKSGFARWKVAFYPIPWWFAAVFIAAAWNLVQALLLRFLPSAAPLARLVGFVLNVAIGMVSSFLMFAVAASDTDVRFGELHRRAFTALKNGWGRYLGWLAMMYLLGFALLLPTIVMGLLFFYPALRVVPFNIGIPVFAVWLCVLIWALLRLWVFSYVYFMDLFVDASGITRAEMGLPDENGGEAETPVTVEIPSAPETPAEEGTDREK